MPDQPKTKPESPPADATAHIASSAAYETAAGSATAPETNPTFGPPANPNEVGTLGPYRVLRELGRGGMGAVYLGFDERLKRRVALKVMLPKYAALASSKNRFLREARAAARIAHDHIVTIYEADEHDGTPYMAMQLLSGYPLDTHLKQAGQLDLPELLRIGREIALGLSAAHEVGLVHRDIKPGNIWLEAPNGRVKILDFGLAKPTDDPPTDQELTATGAMMGTPAYMPPEQARGAKADYRADLFSLGVVLYRLATGAMPFTGDTMMAVLAAVVADDPLPVRERNPAIPEPLAKLIHELLEKRPQNRPKSAAEVAERLEQIRLGTSAAVALPIQVIPLDTLPTITQVPPGADPFANIDATERDGLIARTDRHRLEPPKRHTADQRRPKWPFVAIGLLVVALLLVIPQAISIMTPRGTLVIDTSDPDVEITVKRGSTVLVDRTKQREIGLKVGDDYRIEMVERDGLKLSTDRFAISRNNTTTVKVTVQKPPAKQKAADSSLPPVLSFANDWPGDKTPKSANEFVRDWFKPNAVAHVRGQGSMTFPPVETNEFALDLEFEIRGEGVLAVTLGDGAEFRPELRLWQEKGIGFAHVVRVQERKWFARSTPARMNRAGTVSLVVSAAGTGLFRDGKYLCGTQAMANATVRLSGRSETTNAIISSIRIRPATPAELMEVSAKLGVVGPPDEPGEDPADPDRDAAKLILDRGGRIGTDGGPIEISDGKRLPTRPFRITSIDLTNSKAILDADLKLLGQCRQLVSLSLGGTTVTDTGISALRLHPTLRDVRLYRTAIGDSALATLDTCVELRDLDLNGTRVGPVGLAKLKGLPKLASLQLYDCPNVNESAIGDLAACQALRQLNVKQTKLTADDVTKLVKALPHCRIESDERIFEPMPISNSGLKFDGRSTAVKIPTLSFDGKVPVTIEAWLTAETTLGQERHIFLFGEPGGGLGIGRQGNIGIGFHNGKDWVEEFGEAIPTRQRVHTAAVVTASAFHLYLDGKSVGYLTGTFDMFPPTRPPSLIGVQPSHAPAGHFHGTIHQLRISKSARYLAGFPPAPALGNDADTMALYRCEEGAGTRLTDHSGNNHHGVIENGTWAK